MTHALRDWRYSLPLGALVVVAVLSGLLAWTSVAPAGGVSVPGAPRAATPAPDSDRLQDLATVRAALAVYRQQYGIFPSTASAFATLCARPEDVGCALRAVLPSLPAGDGATPYWYTSDGLNYTLLARADAGDPNHPCPAALPPDLAAGPAVCVSGGVSQ